MTTRVVSREELQRLFKYTVDESGARSPFLDRLRAGAWHGDELVGASIFDRDDVLREVAQSCISRGAPEDRAIGAMLGMVIGDALGARLEFLPVTYDTVVLRDMGSGKGGRSQLEPGQWTDDSSQGFCLADSILSCRGEWDGHDCMQRFVAWWSCGYNNAFAHDTTRRSRKSVGLGSNISMAFAAYEADSRSYQTTAGDKETSGNGSVMRLAAVPIRWWRPDQRKRCEEVAALSSLTTHRGEEAEGCCRLLARSVARGIAGESGKDVLATLSAEFVHSRASVVALAESRCEAGDPDRDWNWRRATYRYSPIRATEKPDYVGSYAMDCLAMALHCVWSTASFEEAVIKAANMCGDADSVASVAGQLAGAFYGASSIPRAWLATVQRWDKGDAALRAYRLYHNSYCCPDS
jgi:ADP-ribosylglycohydrolase